MRFLYPTGTGCFLLTGSRLYILGYTSISLMAGLGRVLDVTTGLLYVGNGQYYDPNTGRFLSRDAKPNNFQSLRAVGSHWRITWPAGVAGAGVWEKPLRCSLQIRFQHYLSTFDKAGKNCIFVCNLALVDIHNRPKKIALVLVRQ